MNQTLKQLSIRIFMWLINNINPVCHCEEAATKQSETRHSEARRAEESRSFVAIAPQDDASRRIASLHYVPLAMTLGVGNADRALNYGR
jgi:hypothetical protein